MQINARRRPRSWNRWSGWDGLDGSCPLLGDFFFLPCSTEEFQERYGRRESSWYRSVELKDHSEYFSNVHYESVSEALEIFKNDELVAEPGSKFHYTTHGFTLLSAVLEKAAGESYISQITRLFKELGMNHSYLDFNHTLISGRAR